MGVTTPQRYAAETVALVVGPAGPDYAAGIQRDRPPAAAECLGLDLQHRGQRQWIYPAAPMRMADFAVALAVVPNHLGYRGSWPTLLARGFLPSHKPCRGQREPNQPKKILLPCRSPAFDRLHRKAGGPGYNFFRGAPQQHARANAGIDVGARAQLSAGDDPRQLQRARKMINGHRDLPLRIQ